MIPDLYIFLIILIIYSPVFYIIFKISKKRNSINPIYLIKNKINFGDLILDYLICRNSTLKFSKTKECKGIFKNIAQRLPIKIYENGFYTMLGFLKPEEVLISWDFFSSFSYFSGNSMQNKNWFSLESNIDPNYQVLIPYSDENKEKVKEVLLRKLPFK